MWLSTRVVLQNCIVAKIMDRELRINIGAHTVSCSLILEQEWLYIKVSLLIVSNYLAVIAQHKIVGPSVVAFSALFAVSAFYLLVFLDSCPFVLHSPSFDFCSPSFLST